MTTKTILAISDTHSNSFATDLMLKLYGTGFMPDLLIHAGDATNFGTEGEMERFGAELVKFREAFPGVPMLYVPGNHDLCFQRNPGLGEAILHDHIPDLKIVAKLQLIDFGDMKILCSPYCPPVGNWAFCMREVDFAQELRNAFHVTLGARADICVSHAPPFGVLDTVFGGNTERIHCGYRPLKDKLAAINTVVCGHIHEHGGKVEMVGSTTVINCAGVPMLHTLKLRHRVGADMPQPEITGVGCP